MSELDWFDFETRAKQFVLTQLEPLHKKQSQNQTEIGSVKKDNLDLGNRLSAIEKMLGLSNRTQGWFQHLESSMQGTREDLKVLETKTEQRWKTMSDRNDSFRLEFSKIWESIHSLGEQMEENYKLTEDLRQRIADNKESLMGGLEDNKQLAMRLHNTICLLYTSDAADE